jgi:hypothetical protein
MTARTTMTRVRVKPKLDTKLPLFSTSSQGRRFIYFSRAYLKRCHGQDGDADRLVNVDVVEPRRVDAEAEDDSGDADDVTGCLDGHVAVEPARVQLPEVASRQHAEGQQHAPSEHGQQPVLPLLREAPVEGAGGSISNP